MSEVGMDTQLVVDLMNDLLNRETHHVHSILIVKDGSLVFEEYFSGFDLVLNDSVLTHIANGGDINFTQIDFNRDALHFQASVTKSITSVLFGIAIDKGFIQGIDEKMFSVFPEYSELNNGSKDGVTLGHMLTMSTGIPWNEDYPYNDSRNSLTSMLTVDDPIEYVLELPLVAPPGNTFIYNSGTTNLLGEIVKRKSDFNLSEFARTYLFTPLGITSFQWIDLPNADGMAFASSGLYLRSRDMAKIGQLVLQEGMWNGSRIVSEEWVTESTRSSITLSVSNPLSDFATGYGYQWWIGTFTPGNSNGYIAAGWGGQYIIVLPELEMVVVITQGDYSWEHQFILYDIMNSHILPAIQ
jgi:CubicO group peptidase (beta-lactamase class C family)